MKHDEIRHKLSEYIDGAVTPQERDAIDGHLKTCPACADALAELRKTIEQVKQVEEIEAPAWLTGRIMANVRTAAEEKKGFLHRLFYPLAVKLPIQAVAVLFLTVTVYSLYTSMHQADKYAEAPMGQLAKQESPQKVQGADKGKSAEIAETRKKKVAQEPGYKSLDMKYEYEKPAPPVPAETPSAPSAAKRSVPRQEREEAAREAQPAAPRAAAPSMMAERAASPESARSYNMQDKDTSVQRKAGSSLSASSGKKEPPQVADRTDLDAEEINAVTEHFVQNDLPAAMKVKGLSFLTYKYHDGLPGLEWIKETRAVKRNPCNNRYLVDVTLSPRSAKYLYCYDTPRLRLIGVFELTNGVWKEKK